MRQSFSILDPRKKWVAPALHAAQRRGYRTREIKTGFTNDNRGGLGFIRPHADPKVLERNHRDYYEMAASMAMVQDHDQVMLYDNKSMQFAKWSHWMPPTRRFTNKLDAIDWLMQTPETPLVSKADVGASSRNVRILPDKAAQIAHVNEIFEKGIVVDHCSGGSEESRMSVQRGYVLLQEQIPHTVTWRVNVIGGHNAIFMRYNYPDRPVAQTGNVEPAFELDDQKVSLLAFAREVFADIKTKWCAADILWDSVRERWWLIETSLAWPWPSPGECNRATFFKPDYSHSHHKWIDMWDLMLDEYEAGVFG